MKRPPLRSRVGRRMTPANPVSVPILSLVPVLVLGLALAGCAGELVESEPRTNDGNAEFRGSAATAGALVSRAELPVVAASEVRFGLPAGTERPPAYVPPAPMPRKPGSRSLLNPIEAAKPVWTTAKRLSFDRWTPAQPESPSEYCDGSCNILGADDRAPVATTSVKPYSQVVKLLMRYGSDWYGCSGVLIKRNFVLTAGHCLFSWDKTPPAWADQIVVTPGLDGSSAPFGSTFGDAWFSQQGWTGSPLGTNGEDDNYDIGLVRLGNALGEVTGWMGFAAYPDSDLRGIETTAGYPYDPPYDAIKMVVESGVTYPSSQLICSSALDTCSGQSGAGLWTDDPARCNGPCVTSVLSGYGGPCAAAFPACLPPFVGCTPHARFTRIDGDRFNWMVSQVIVPHASSCTSGPCCDSSGSYRPTSYICNSAVATTYQCSGKDCGATAQRRVLVQHCPGDKETCNGGTEWQTQDLATCGANQICTTDGATYAQCNTCPAGCSGGSCLSGNGDAGLPDASTAASDSQPAAHDSVAAADTSVAAAQDSAATTQDSAATTQDSAAAAHDSTAAADDSAPSQPPSAGGCSCRLQRDPLSPTDGSTAFAAGLLLLIGAATIRRRCQRQGTAGRMMS